MKILYFTASGNCLAVARRFPAEYLSIPQMIRNHEYLIEDDAVGIVYPVYGNSVPGIVRRYLKKCTIRADYIFVIATYGNLAGGTLNEIRRILSAKGIHAQYLTTLLMVDNYLPFFEVNRQVSLLGRKKTEENLQRIVREVSARECRDQSSPAAAGVLSSAVGALVRGTAKITPRLLFHVSNACIGCGVCARVCPRANVSQNGKEKPSFGFRCESCFACVHNCPKQAIHLRTERSAARFRNPETTLEDIIAANNQS